jgi:hypothetical protein
MLSLIFYSSTTTIDIFYAAIDNSIHYCRILVTQVQWLSTVSVTRSSIGSITAYGKTEDEVKGIMSALVAALDKLNITYTLIYSKSATYLEHVSSLWKFRSRFWRTSGLDS